MVGVDVVLFVVVARVAVLLVPVDCLLECRNVRRIVVLMGLVHCSCCCCKLWYVVVVAACPCFCPCPWFVVVSASRTKRSVMKVGFAGMNMLVESNCGDC